MVFSVISGNWKNSRGRAASTLTKDVGAEALGCEARELRSGHSALPMADLVTDPAFGGQDPLFQRLS